MNQNLNIHLHKKWKSLSLILFLLLIILLVFFILYNANWLFGDDVEFLRSTAIGIIEPISTHMHIEGRFCPLCHYDFNILTLIPGARTALAHYWLVALSFLVFVAFASLLFRKIISEVSKLSTFNSWLMVFCVIFLITRTYNVFLDAIFPERIVILLMTLFMFLSIKFYESDKIIYAIFALLIAIYSVYCKEPVFGALLVFSGTNLFFNFHGLTKNQRIFHFALVVNSFIFLVLYYFLVFRNTTTFYTGGSKLMSMSELIIKALRNEKVLVLAIVLSLLRLYSILLKKRKENLLLDGFLFAGIAYAGAIVFLGLSYSYYYLPAMVLCLPSVIYWSIHYFRVRWVTIIMFICVIYYSVKPVYWIKDNQERRLNTYRQMTQLASFTQEGYTLDWYQSDLTNTANEYDATVRGWKMYVVQAYVKYILKDNKSFALNIVTSFDTTNITKTIVLYPSENKVNKQEHNLFQIIIKQYNLQCVNEIAGIQVFEPK